MAKFIPGFAAVAKKPHKFCHGYGIFQYDLQFFLVDPDFFLEKRWASFDASLGKAMGELKSKRQKIGLGEKATLTDLEMVAIAIAYNTGGFKPAKGLKQGHFDGTRFYGEAWKVGDLDLPDKDPLTYPVWTESFVAAARGEFERTLQDVLASDGDLRELFTGRRTFVDAELAAFYGIAVPPDPTTAVELPPERTGLLTSVAVIGANSPANRSSVVFRGKFVFERLLCQPIPPPPDDVDTSNPSADRTQPPCSSCHQLLDPLGVTFEHFDGVAGWRDEQDGVPVDAVGTYGGATFDGANDLAAWLVEDPRMPGCLARQAFEYAAGRVPTKADEPLLAEMTTALVAGEFAPRDLLLAVVTSPAFRYLAPPE